MVHGKKAGLGEISLTTENINSNIGASSQKIVLILHSGVHWELEMRVAEEHILVILVKQAKACYNFFVREAAELMPKEH